MSLNAAAVGVIFVFLADIITFGSGEHWGYGPEAEQRWPGVCTKGKKQSPINLGTDIAERRHIPSIEFDGYSTQYKPTIRNNGHSIKVTFDFSNGKPSIEAGGLPRKYNLDSLHFHWLSEHTIGGKRFPLELHLVHFADTPKKNLSVAESIAVVSVLYELSEDDNKDFDALIDGIAKIKEPLREPVTLDAFVKLEDFLPDDIDSFYRYPGSLTTPLCNEVVVWTVFAEQHTISKKQVEQFETIWTEQSIPLTRNYRQIQPLNHRVVFLSDDRIEEDIIDTNTIPPGSLASTHFLSISAFSIIFIIPFLKMIR